MATPEVSRRTAVPLFPPQHGAWAFLGLPVAAAATIAPATPVLMLLVVAWVAAYPASYFLLALARDASSRRPDPRRFRRPLALWWSVTLAASIPLLVLRPWLAWVALAYALSFAINIGYARRRDERALGNDAVFVIQCAAMVPVTWLVATDDAALPLDLPAHVWVLTTAVALLLAGSTLQVKSLIRERADLRYARAARAFALGSLAAAIALATWWGLPGGAWLALPFAWFAGRAFVVHPGLRPARIGLVELVGFLLLVASAALAESVTPT